LLVSFSYIVICYSFVIYKLLGMGAEKKELTGHSYSSEIRKYALYIVVYTLWVHPYVAISLMALTGYPLDETYYNFWLYFLLMINSLGTLNFFAYGYSEGWYREWKRKINSTMRKSGDAHYSSTPGASKMSKNSMNSMNSKPSQSLFSSTNSLNSSQGTMNVLDESVNTAV